MALDKRIKALEVSSSTTSIVTVGCFEVELGLYEFAGEVLTMDEIRARLKPNEQALFIDVRSAEDEMASKAQRDRSTDE